MRFGEDFQQEESGDSLREKEGMEEQKNVFHKRETIGILIKIQEEKPLYMEEKYSFLLV